nr:MAG TPA: hypothetical protein [Caudoviricetes sp.]
MFIFYICKSPFLFSFAKRVCYLLWHKYTNSLYGDKLLNIKS